MSFIAVVLLTFAAFFHAVWNLVSKQHSPCSAFFLAANLWGALIFLPVVIFCWQQYLDFPARVWGLVFLSGLFQAVYFSSLAKAYQNGSISFAYPLVRSSPILVVLAVTFLLGQRESISDQCIIGIVLVVSGCFFVPLEKFSQISFKNYINLTCCFAFVAAVGTAGYSITDDQSLSVLSQHMTSRKDIFLVTMLYAFVEALFTVFWLCFFTAGKKSGRQQVVMIFTKESRAAAFSGFLIYLTYTLVLVSMLLVDNVSYVVGFRQLSIPLGAVFGMTLLKEPTHLPKVYGILILCAGLLLIGTG